MFDTIQCPRCHGSVTLDLQSVAQEVTVYLSRRLAELGDQEAPQQVVVGLLDGGEGGIARRGNHHDGLPERCPRGNSRRLWGSENRWSGPLGDRWEMVLDGAKGGM